MEFTINRIFDRDKRAQAALDALLVKESISRDNNLDLTLGIYHEDQLVATGSSFKNTLRCVAVDSNYQGEGLMNLLITELLNLQHELGYAHSFVYTKVSSARFFKDLGFYPIAELDNLVFLENKKNGFENYLNKLEQESAQFIKDKPQPLKIGAIIMNANPFTLGHQYLVEQAAKEVDLLHLFMVSDDSSIVPFAVRKDLVRRGTAHLDNLVYHETGDYLISMATFPAYFLKDDDTVINTQAALDVQVFAQIGKRLGITHRFIGNEPFSHVTNAYNQVMIHNLAQAGIRVHVLERKEQGDQPISASYVRQLIQQGKVEEIKKWVPESTYQYFTSPQALEIIGKIQAEDNVVHY